MLRRLLALCCLVSAAHASVFLITRDNVSFVFDDADAAFGGMMPPMGMQGALRQAVPYDGCSPFDQMVDPGTATPQFALIMRGNCQFDVKVLNAQLAGYSAAVIYNNEEGAELITMSGRHLWDIYIPAVFVTLGAGKQMLSLTEQLETVCFLTPAFDNTAWSVMTASFLSLLALCSVLTLFVYIRRARLREMALRVLEAQGHRARGAPGLTEAEVKALPEVAYREGADECRGLETCAICLEDYEGEETLRVLPCKHGFHAACIDQWLTTRSPCCPVCKRDCKQQHLSREASDAGDEASTSGSVRDEDSGPTASAAGAGSDDRGALRARLLQVSIMGIPIPARFNLASIFLSSQGALEDPLLPVVAARTDSLRPAAEQGVAAEASAPVSSPQPGSEDTTAPLRATIGNEGSPV